MCIQLDLDDRAVADLLHHYPAPSAAGPVPGSGLEANFAYNTFTHDLYQLDSA